MRKQAIVCVLLLGAALAFAAPVRAQQIEITEMAGLAQIFGEGQDNDVPLSMNGYGHGIRWLFTLRDRGGSQRGRSGTGCGEHT